MTNLRLISNQIKNTIMPSREIKQSSQRYYVNHDGQVRGPFNLQMVEVMVLAEQFPPNLFVCKEGTEEWIPLNSLNQPPYLNQPPRLENEEISSPKENYGADSPSNASLKIVASVVGLIIVGGSISILSGPSKSNSYSSAETSYKPPVSSYVPPKATYSSSSYTSKTEYSSQNASSGSTLYNDAQGRRYRVPNTSYQQINAKKTRLEIMQRSINTAHAELDSLSAEIDHLRGSIDRTSQYQIDSFNDKVRAFNAKESRNHIQIDQFNAAVNEFNAELIRVGTLIR